MLIEVRTGCTCATTPAEGETDGVRPVRVCLYLCAGVLIEVRTGCTCADTPAEGEGANTPAEGEADGVGPVRRPRSKDA